ncbi:hypothetical protein C922_03410 [Plasmodium inui San Antonio 1]|uniref:Uncharacterized protein n=1 Tax=Plasmodium inui San Antonio 1 TaxID=1237626 RepID=W7A3I4_9APIC|nr:hypothetical protein C922_03410 [Plasmodium inui San Antonio 1]EUD66215.1 hypothetical protein C922_03410 [Plasmodium inui San Antonio 1]
MGTHIRPLKCVPPLERDHGGSFVRPSQGIQEGTLSKGTAGTTVQRGAKCDENACAIGCANQPIVQLECPPKMKTDEVLFGGDPSRRGATKVKMPHGRVPCGEIRHDALPSDEIGHLALPNELPSRKGKSLGGGATLEHRLFEEGGI